MEVDNYGNLLNSGLSFSIVNAIFYVLSGLCNKVIHSDKMRYLAQGPPATSWPTLCTKKEQNRTRDETSSTLSYSKQGLLMKSSTPKP